MQDRHKRIIIRATVVVLILIICIDTLITFKYSSLVTLNSDLVQNVLEVSSILRGNLFLHGWMLPSDNFYLSDNPFFLAARLLFGRTLAAIDTADFLIYLTVLVTSVAIVWSSASDPRALAIGLGAVAFYLATPGLSDLAPLALHGAVHIAELAFCLLAWLTLNRIESDANGPRAGQLVLYALFTFILFLSDPLSTMIFLLPTMAALLWTFLVSPDRPRRQVWMMVVTSLSFAAARLALFAIQNDGGFHLVSNFSLRFVNAADLALNLEGAFFGLIQLSGGYVFGASAQNLSTIFALMHLLGLIVVGLATVSALARRATIGWNPRLTLALAVCMNLASSVLSASFTADLIPNALTGGASSRYLIPTIVFGALLAALELPFMLQRITASRLRIAATALPAAAVVAATGLFFVNGLQRWHEKPVMAHSAEMKIGRWLLDHRLTHGVGSYWQGSIVTALSGERVEVRPVGVANGKLVPFDYLSDRSWYPAHEPPQFVLYAPGNDFSVNPKTIEATYGKVSVRTIDGLAVAIVDRSPRTMPSR